jgi:RNA polymerase sigma-54 factor
MKPSMQQSTSLRQELRMNPRLYQAMDLLYMPLLDLQQHLKQELLVNPFLELIEPEDEAPIDEKPDTEREREEAKKEEETNWEDIILDGFQVGGSGARDLSESDEAFERVPVQTRALTDHLHDQLRMLDLTDRQRLLAEEFLGNLGDDGYLHATLEEIVAGTNAWLDGRRAPGADQEGDDETDEDAAAPVPASVATAAAPAAPAVLAAPAVAVAPAAAPAPAPGDAPGEPAAFTLAEAEEMLGIIQQLDPPGIGARDLRECLLLQLDDLDLRDSLTYRLVFDAFADLIGHRWSDIAKRYGIDPKTVQDAADELAKLDPKPGLRFLPSDDEYVVPDLIVEKIDGVYRVFLNDGGMPRLRISKVYQDLAADKKQFTGETREFITEKLNGAQWLIQAIEQRRQTMLKVMHFIVDRQREFFEKGIEYLRPLTLREVAEVINMHESTVSRVTNQKYVQTPRGVFPLKFFFSSSLETTSGEDASARAVRAQIEKLVADEQPGRPLTDAEIVDALKDRGVRIARRTVAKYRDQLGILPARMRKRL